MEGGVLAIIFFRIHVVFSVVERSYVYVPVFRMRSSSFIDNILLNVPPFCFQFLTPSELQSESDVCHLIAFSEALFLQVKNLKN